jgi:hypothetical protein
MRLRRTTPDSSDDGDGSDTESFLDTEDERAETGADTDPTDADTDVDGRDDIEGGDEAESSVDREKGYPPHDRLFAASRLRAQLRRPCTLLPSPRHS